MSCGLWHIYVIDGNSSLPSMANSLVDTDPPKVASTGVVCSSCSTRRTRLDAARAPRGLIRSTGHRKLLLHKRASTFIRYSVKRYRNHVPQPCKETRWKEYVQESLSGRIYIKGLVPRNKCAYRRCHKGWAPQQGRRSSLRRSRIRKDRRWTGSAQSPRLCRISAIGWKVRVGGYTISPQSSPDEAAVPYSFWGTCKGSCCCPPLRCTQIQGRLGRCNIKTCISLIIAQWAVRAKFTQFLFQTNRIWRY